MFQVCWSQTSIDKNTQWTNICQTVDVLHFICVFTNHYSIIHCFFEEWMIHIQLGWGSSCDHFLIVRYIFPLRAFQLVSSKCGWICASSSKCQTRTVYEGAAGLRWVCLLYVFFTRNSAEIREECFSVVLIVVLITLNQESRNKEFMNSGKVWNLSEVKRPWLWSGDRFRAVWPDF